MIIIMIILITVIITISINTHVIIEIRSLSLVENGVIRYIHLRLIFKLAASRFVDVSEEEINIMKRMLFRETANMPQSSE